MIFNVRLTHLSIGQTNDSWEDNRKQFETEYKENLPIVSKGNMNYVSKDFKYQKKLNLKIIINSSDNLDNTKKLLDKIKLLPEKTRRKLLINYASVFLLFGSVAYLTQSADQYNADKKIVKEFIKVTKKASFEVSQKAVALAEGDYSNDKGDTGNFVDFEMGGKKLKRFVGS